MMKDLPFLLRLLDDPSPRVYAKVEKRLRELGPDVWAEIVEQRISLSPELEKMLRALVPLSVTTPNPSLIMPENWLSWLDLPTEEARLESGWGLLSRWQLEAAEEMPRDLKGLLDDLAAGFIASDAERTPTNLVRYLADKIGLRGATPEDYYNPLNSNLAWVSEQHKGLPITLAGIYILVGARVGITLWGCNFPGHFLVAASNGEQELFFDPFNGGYEFAEEEVEALRRAAPEAVRGGATAQDIIARVLRNLAVAYQHQGSLESARSVYELLSRLETAINGNASK